MADITIAYKIPPTKQVRVGYRVAGSGAPFTYLSRYLFYYETPYTISGLDGNISYEIELTTVSNTCGGGPCSTPVYFAALAQEYLLLNSFINFAIDTSGNLNITLEFAIPLSNQETISGAYIIEDTAITGSAHSENWAVTIPTGATVYNKVLKTVTTTSKINSYCTSSIVPTTTGGKTIVFVNALPC